MGRSLVLALCCGSLTLAGCATEETAAPPPPVSRTAVIDGIYRGTANGSCGANQSARMEVRDGGFVLAVSSGLHVDGTAEPDGTLTAVERQPDGRDLNFTGRIDRLDMRGGSYNGRCAFAFTMRRGSDPPDRR